MLQLKYDMPMGTKKSDFGLSLVIIYVSWVYSYLLPACGDLCRLLIIFANSLYPDQDLHSVGPGLNPNCLIDTLIVFLKEFFKKKYFLKKINIMKNYPACKELILGQ